MAKDYKTSTFLETGITAVLGGVAANAIYPGFGPYCYAISAMGAASIAYYAFSWCKLDQLFKNLNLGINGAFPLLKKRHKTDKGMAYEFTLPTGLTTDDFEKHSLAISQHLGCPVKIKYNYKKLIIEAITKNDVFMPEYKPVKINGNVPLLIGYTDDADLIKIDLSSGEPHALIAGESGSGKSTALRSMITNLILKSKVTIHLCDLKNGAEFGIFSKSSRVTTFARTTREVYQLLNSINAEIDRRYDLFFENDVVDIKEYNNRLSPLDYQLIVVDEFADLQDDKHSIKLLERIAAKARACGIHLLLATQRPDRQVLNGRIKANIPTVLGLKTMNGTNSRIIIDEDGLERLRGKGHGLFIHSSVGKVELQVPFLSPEACRDLVRPTYIDKPKTTATTTAPTATTVDYDKIKAQLYDN